MNCSLPKPPEFPLFRFDLVGRAGFDNDSKSSGEGAVDRAEARMVLYRRGLCCLSLTLRALRIVAAQLGLWI